MACIQEANVAATNEAMNDPEWFGLIADTRNKLLDNYYDSGIVNAVFQNYRTGISIYDAYPFLLTWIKIARADVITAIVDVGIDPSIDSDISGINEQLNNNLCYPFTGRFWGECEETDGLINIASDILMSGYDHENNISVKEYVNGDFPLEVGTQTAAKTCVQLHKHGRLARWAYGSNYIYLFQSVDKDKAIPKTIL